MDAIVVKPMPVMNQEQIKVIQQNQLFDEAWYTQQYPDVKTLEISPLEHYMRLGWIMGRNPSVKFQTTKYLNENPEAKQSNPIIHFVSKHHRHKTNTNENQEKNQHQPDKQTVSTKQKQELSNDERIKAQLEQTQKLLESYYIRCQELETELIAAKVKYNKTKKKLKKHLEPKQEQSKTGTEIQA